MKRYQITVNGQAYDVTVKELGELEGNPSAATPIPTAAATETVSAEKPTVGEGISITAPMPGTILEVMASSGDLVEAGKPLMVLEAMKMENDIVSPQEGKITSVLVKKGDTVRSGDILATMTGS